MVGEFWSHETTQIESVVTPSGNSGYLVVPKAWRSRPRKGQDSNNSDHTLTPQFTSGAI
jgi:hypothetical protein